MSDFLANSHWWWLLGGMGLLAAELLIPGVYLVWIGLAALLTGLLAFVLPVSAELGAFALLSVAATYLARDWYRKRPVPTSDPLLNDRAARLVGEIVTVIETVDGGRGRVRVGDGVWSARGEALEQGARARVVDYDGQILLVEPL